MEHPAPKGTPQVIPPLRISKFEIKLFDSQNITDKFKTS